MNMDKYNEESERLTPHATGNAEGPQSWQEIALETAEEIAKTYPILSVPSVSNLIVSAIKKGTKAWLSEQREWTLEYVAQMFEKNFAGDTVAAICCAHNAAIAAAQENIRLRADKMQALTSDNVDLRNQLAKAQLAAERRLLDDVVKGQHQAVSELEQELATERQRREQAERWMGELLAVIHGDGGHYQTEHGIEKAAKDAIGKHNQLVARIDVLEFNLLSAQAAVDEHNGDPMSEDCPVIEIDLSALHEHDAEEFKKGWEAGNKAGLEVRKPLVDVLERIRMAAYGGSSVDGNTPELRLSSIGRRCDDALAKVKERE